MKNNFNATLMYGMKYLKKHKQFIHRRDLLLAQTMLNLHKCLSIVGQIPPAHV